MLLYPQYNICQLVTQISNEIRHRTCYTPAALVFRPIARIKRVPQRERYDQRHKIMRRFTTIDPQAVQRWPFASRTRAKHLCNAMQSLRDMGQRHCTETHIRMPPREYFYRNDALGCHRMGERCGNKPTILSKIPRFISVRRPAASVVWAIQFTRMANSFM